MPADAATEQLVLAPKASERVGSRITAMCVADPTQMRTKVKTALQRVIERDAAKPAAAAAAAAVSAAHAKPVGGKKGKGGKKGATAAPVVFEVVPEARSRLPVAVTEGLFAPEPDAPATEPSAAVAGEAAAERRKRKKAKAKAAKAAKDTAGQQGIASSTGRQAEPQQQPKKAKKLE